MAENLDHTIRLRDHYNALSGIMDSVFEADKDLFAKVATIHSLELPEDWLAGKLSQLNTDQAAEVLTGTEAPRRFGMAGHANLLIEKMNQMSNEQIAKIFSYDCEASEFSSFVSNKRWFFDKFDALNNDQLTEILSVALNVEVYVNGDVSAQAVKRIDSLENNQVTRILKTSFAVQDIAHAGFDTWVFNKIDSLPIEDQAEILKAHDLAEYLTQNDRLEWLKAKISSFTDEQKLAVFESGEDSIGYESEDYRLFIATTLQEIEARSGTKPSWSPKKYPEYKHV